MPAPRQRPIPPDGSISPHAPASRGKSSSPGGPTSSDRRSSAGAAAAELVPRVPPLDPEERGQADRAARRVRGELLALLDALPPEARHASGLARFLGVDRTSCQRVVFLVSRPYPGLELYERLPGVRALRALEAAAREAKPAIERGIVDALGAAVTQLQETIATLGGSLARLCRRIQAEGAEVAQPLGRPAAGGAGSRLFEAAHEVTGRASECWVAVYIYRPSPTDPERVEVLRANGLRGHTARRDAVPLVVHNFSSSDDVQGRFESLESAAAESGPTIVLDDFTSDPSPLVTARQPGEFLVQSVDTPSGGTGEPVDLMLATRATIAHPAHQQPPIEEVWALVNFPSRHLLLDVYLHPDLARSSAPSLDAHLWGPDFAERSGDRWRTRFSETPPLQLLGSGVRRAGHEAFPRLPELTLQLFERAGIDADAYVGFRCDVDYPLWRTGYCITFDFG
ncbi:MAG: hypothetical protein AAF682_00025 [Planctomycetota bacterium]